MKKVCFVCNKIYTANKNQMYCGSLNDKTSCRYKEKQKRDRKYTQKKLKNRQTNPKEREKFSIRMRNYQRKYKNINEKNYRIK